MAIAISLPDAISIPLAVRRDGAASAGHVMIIPAQMDPAVLAEVFDYGLRQIIRDAAAAGDEAAFTKARDRAEAMNSGLHWRTRKAGTQRIQPDAWLKEAITLALPAILKTMPNGAKKADWLKDEEVQARLRAKAESLRPQAEAIVAARQAAIDAAD